MFRFTFKIFRYSIHTYFNISLRVHIYLCTNEVSLFIPDLEPLVFLVCSLTPLQKITIVILINIIFYFSFSDLADIILPYSVMKDSTKAPSIMFRNSIIILPMTKFRLHFHGDRSWCLNFTSISIPEELCCFMG